MKYLKQYGLQRSGTNYMRALFEMNLDVRVLANVGGHKHSKVTNATNMRQVKTELSKEEIAKIDKMLVDGRIPKVAVIMNPYHWVVNYAHYVNKKLTDQFVTEQIDKYIEINGHWQRECDYVLYYEEMVECPQVIINQAANAFNLNHRNQDVVTPTGEMKRGGDIPAEQNIMGKVFDMGFYHKREYMGELTKKQIDYIDSRKPLMKFLNED